MDFWIVGGFTYLSMADSRGGNAPGEGRPGAGDCPWDKIRPGKEKPAGIQKGGGPGDRNSAGMAEPAFFYKEGCKEAGENIRGEIYTKGPA